MFDRCRQMEKIAVIDVDKHRHDYDLYDIRFLVYDRLRHVLWVSRRRTEKDSMRGFDLFRLTLDERQRASEEVSRVAHISKWPPGVSHIVLEYATRTHGDWTLAHSEINGSLLSMVITADCAVLLFSFLDMSYLSYHIEDGTLSRHEHLRGKGLNLFRPINDDIFMTAYGLTLFKSMYGHSLIRINGMGTQYGAITPLAFKYFSPSIITVDAEAKIHFIGFGWNGADSYCGVQAYVDGKLMDVPCDDLDTNSVLISSSRESRFYHISLGKGEVTPVNYTNGRWCAEAAKPFQDSNIVSTWKLDSHTIGRCWGNPNDEYVYFFDAANSSETIYRLHLPPLAR